MWSTVCEFITLVKKELSRENMVLEMYYDLWTPCSKKLPDKAGVYLVTESNQGGIKPAEQPLSLVHESAYHPKHGWLGNRNYFSDDCSEVIAWMPMVDAYVKE